MLACGQRALARVSYMTSTRAKAPTTPKQTVQYYAGKLTLFVPGLTNIAKTRLIDLSNCESIVFQVRMVVSQIFWSDHSQRYARRSYPAISANIRKPEVVSLENCFFRIMLATSMPSKVAEADSNDLNPHMCRTRRFMNR